ncbi:MAG: NUDIX hydrolase [Verrucomicrobiales bacterium VVV1]|nr:MAG: NUDIX hydrolase [Verrucomicrobiales bacterium VVV1]
MFRNLIFDWSGTLVDDLGPVLEATNSVFGKYGLDPFDRDRFRRHFRLPYREFYEEFLPGVALEELEQHFRPAFRDSLVPVTVLPHAREKLEWCADNGIRAFVLTSMDAEAFHRQLADFGMQEFFEATYSGVLDKRDLIHQILETHQLNPSETAFVGDMTHDVETARHGGVSSIAVLTGYTHAEPLAAVRPDITVPDLGVLRGLLGKRIQSGRPVPTVGALIRHDSGRVLMVRTHKWGDKWGIPGGKIRRGETSIAALKREIREETALEIDQIRFALVQDCIDSPEFERPEHFLLLNYIARTASTEVRLNDEAEEFRWVSPADALSLDLNHPTRFLLVEAMERGLIDP